MSDARKHVSPSANQDRQVAVSVPDARMHVCQVGHPTTGCVCDAEASGSEQSGAFAVFAAAATFDHFITIAFTGSQAAKTTHLNKEDTRTSTTVSSINGSSKWSRLSS